MNWSQLSGWEILLMLVIWLAAILIIVKLLRKVMKSNFGSLPDGPKTALDILYERFTREEISREEYDRLRQELLKK